MRDALQLPPPTIFVTKERKRDLDTLLLFYDDKEPVFLNVHSCKADDYAYICGNASAAAYATGNQWPDGTTMVALANWTPNETAQSSNWREATNLALIFCMRLALVDWMERMCEGAWTI